MVSAFSEIELLILLLLSIVFLSLAFVSFAKDPLSVFIAFWLLFPNLATGIIGISGVPMFTYLETFCGFLLLIFVSAAKKRNGFGNKTEHTFIFYRKTERYLITFLLAILLLQYCIFTWVSTEISFKLVTELTGAILLKNLAPEFTGFIFFYACYRLILAPNQIVKLLTIFAIFPLLLFLEYVYGQLNLPYSIILKSFSINETNQFNSIFLNDYSIVGLVCGVGGLVSLYKFKLNKNILWILMFLVSSFFVVFNLKRGVIVSYSFAALVLLYFLWIRHWGIEKKGFAITIVILVCFSLVGLFNSDMILNMESGYAKGRILNLGSTDSIIVRSGIQLRMFEILYSVWPLGFGNDFGQFFFSAEGQELFEVRDKHLAEGFYRDIATNTHNLYIEQIVSYGFLGFIFVLATIRFVIRNLLSGSFYFRSDSKESAFYALVVSLVVFLAIFYNFLAYPRAYVVVFLVIHATAVISDQARRLRQT